MLGALNYGVRSAGLPAGWTPLLFLWLGMASATGRADDWREWLGPSHNSHSPEKGWRKDWPESGPPRLFEKEVGEGYSTVAVAQGSAVLFHRVGDEMVVEALDALRGEQKWRYAYPTDYQDNYGYNGGPRAQPIVERVSDTWRAYTLCSKGVLTALELETGKKVWSHDLPGEFKIPENFFGVGAAPLADGGKIYVHAGGTDLGTGLAFAIDAARGEVLWKSPTDGGSYAAPRLAEIDSARQLFVFHRGGLTCFDPDNGKERWKYPWRSRTYESVNAATPVVVGDICLISATYGTGAVCFKVKKDAFEVIWKDDLESRRKSLETHWSTAIPLDGRVYGFSGRHESGCDLRCVELATGKVLWTRESYLGRGSMLYADGHFIVLGERGDLCLFQLGPEGPKELRRVRGVLAYPSWAPPVLANGVLYLRGEHKLIAFDLRSPAPAH